MKKGSTDLPTAPFSNTPAHPIMIGWKEYVNFPEWQIHRVKAKIDTGARTSALDVASYELRQTDAGLVASFSLMWDRRHPDRLTEVRTPVLQMVVVRNSSGLCEQRPLVETNVVLGPVTRRVQFTITNRAGMCFRLILGRKVLAGAFLVDVGQKYLLGNGAQREFNSPNIHKA